ncbi:MAG: Lrp/AsnC family transcriptional regulator [Saprospiraceae bacterium]|nr:Lrp/AsnC family transcriptional regulator [Saprospiraceae bacterium]
MADKLDKVDIRILNFLQENSKITNLELSRKIGLSPAPTLERVKKLEQLEIIESYHAKINPNKVNLSISTFVLINLAWHIPGAMDSFVAKIKEIDEITDCYVITGDADILMRVVCKDIQAYENLLFRKLSQIKEVERLKTLMTLSIVKSSNKLPIRLEDIDS